MCYWCQWGWPKPIREIYDDAIRKLGGDDWPMHFGPAHVVWGDENWNSAQWCLDNFDAPPCSEMTGHEAAVVAESLVRLLAVPDEFKNEPSGFIEYESDPADFPPPAHWECERR